MEKLTLVSGGQEIPVLEIHPVRHGGVEMETPTGEAEVKEIPDRETAVQPMGILLQMQHQGIEFVVRLPSTEAANLKVGQKVELRKCG